MVRPQFNFFITQEDGTIFGSAVDPENQENLSYIISKDGTVTARKEDAWYPLDPQEASFIRVLAGQAYRFCTNYFTRQRVF